MSENEKLALQLDGLTKSSVVHSLKKCLKFISIDLTISVFGIKLLDYHFPPKTTQK